MKYLFIGVFTLLCLFACQSNDSKYIIEGTLPTAQQDGEWIYLAPMENASIENIDSASQVPRATGRNGTGCDLSTDRLHQLGLRYTAKRRLAALERPEAKDR